MLDRLDGLEFLAADEPVVLASADDLVSMQDLDECNIFIQRWKKTIRVRAPDLDQQEMIENGSLVKNPKTQVWERSEPIFCALTLRECVVSPKLDDGQAQRLRKKSPAVIRRIVNFIWNIAPLDYAAIERIAHSAANLEGAATNTQAAPGDATST